MIKVHVCDVILRPMRRVPQIDLKLDRYWELSAIYSRFRRAYEMTSRIEVKLRCLRFNIGFWRREKNGGWNSDVISVCTTCTAEHCDKCDGHLASTTYQVLLIDIPK